MSAARIEVLAINAAGILGAPFVVYARQGDETIASHGCIQSRGRANMLAQELADSLGGVVVCCPVDPA
jgi:hypothetical protein